jgi:hypothetical protein
LHGASIRVSGWRMQVVPDQQRPRMQPDPDLSLVVGRQPFANGKRGFTF